MSQRFFLLPAAMNSAESPCALIADTAALLEIETPEHMNRGSAADWLDANDANVVLRLGEDKA